MEKCAIRFAEIGDEAWMRLNDALFWDDLIRRKINSNEVLLANYVRDRMVIII
jgi:hypothetical protein